MSRYRWWEWQPSDDASITPTIRSFEANLKPMNEDRLYIGATGKQSKG